VLKQVQHDGLMVTYEESVIPNLFREPIINGDQHADHSSCGLLKQVQHDGLMVTYEESVIPNLFREPIITVTNMLITHPVGC